MTHEQMIELGITLGFAALGFWVALEYRKHHA
jgi:hypothetical protein